jgi:hypothetical protein
MANSKQMSADDLFNLLDKEIDDIKDLPSFKSPFTGMYKLHVKAEPKPINDKPALVFNFTVRELIELADNTIPEEERSKAGDKFNVTCVLKDDEGNDSEMGWGKVKEFAKPFQAHFSISNLRAVIQGPLTEGVDITALVKRVLRKKKTKDEDDQWDARVENITID